ncbi:MAG: phosphotransferase [Pseudomonadota bacterium]
MGQSVSLPAAAPAFLAAEGWGAAVIEEFSADAAFRRYFRLSDGARTAILMHAPDPSERSAWFVELAREIRARGMSGPDIYAEDMDHGLILLEDLGTRQYFDLLRHDTSDEATLYAAATDVLIALHDRPMPDRLGAVPIDRYARDRLLQEAELLLDWHWPELKGAAATDAVRRGHAEAWRSVLDHADYDADRLVQLDYHSPNLMWLPARDGPRRVGILDFQDAMRGPGAYDLVSLLQDARRDLAPGLEGEMVARYLAGRGDLDTDRFSATYALMGAQRAARILGVFVRLWRRDGKPRYLAHLPRLWAHLDTNLAHPAMAPLRDWFAANLPPGERRALKDDR